MIAPSQELAAAFGAISVAAGAPIMALYGRAQVRTKIDSSLVTDADLAAEEVILTALARLVPGVPVLSEERAAAGILPPEAETFIAVDPLDGTREFVNGNGEFTVNIALISRGVPVCGAVYAPARGELWMGAKAATFLAVAPGAALAGAGTPAPIGVRAPPAAGMMAVMSRSHSDQQTVDFLATLPVAERRSIGSSIKFCLVAQGLADVYPRFGPTMEWDTAAGDAVLRAAGGRVLTPDGAPFVYGKRAQNFRNGSFVASGSGAPFAAALRAGE